MTDEQLQECKDVLAEAERLDAPLPAISTVSLRRLLDCIDAYDRLQKNRCHYA